MNGKKSFKERLWGGDIVLGTHTYSASPANVEIIGRAGFDWVMIDCEHAPVGPYDTLLLENLLRAAELSGATPLVRVPENNETMIMKVLDSGAAGVVVPHVSTAEAARRAVAATRYGPDGTRGCCSNTRATGYYSRLMEQGRAFWKTANDSVVTIILVEEYEAVENIEAIVEVPGIDAVYIGPRDMAMTMGEEDINAPRVKEAIAHLTRVISSKGIAIGRPFYYPDLNSAADLVKEGVTFLACTSDIRIFFTACSQITGGVKDALSKETGSFRSAAKNSA
ncbi:HpcH/HpaI aldolase family protein [Pseudochelatococcus sp. B33]